MKSLPFLATSLVACGAAQPGMPTDPIGTLPGAAVAVELQVGPLQAGLDAFQDRVGSTGLGPLGPAWARTRQAVQDALADFGSEAAPGLAEAWGLPPTAEIQGAIAAPQAAELGRALLARLRGEEPALPAVVVHGRVTSAVAAPDRFLAQVERVADRLGLDHHRPGRGPRPGWLGDAALPADVSLVGRDEPTGVWWAIRIRNESAALDVLVPPRAGPGQGLLAHLAADAPPPPSTGANVAVRIHPARLAALEAALDAHIGLMHPDPAVQQAAAAVLGTCTQRWTEVAALADTVEAAVAFTDGRPGLRVVARLTDEGMGRWGSAARPLPLPHPPGPLGWQVGWSAAPFGDPLGPGWLEETASCGAGHPLVAVLAAVPVLPQVLPPEVLPAVQPPEGFGLETLDGAAGGVVGATAGDEGSVPHLVGLVRGRGRPLRPAAEAASVGGELRWATPGKVPTLLSFRDIGGGRAVGRFGLGTGALEGLGGEGGGGALLQADADPTALAALLRAAGEAGPEVEALAGLGARLGRLVIRLERQGPLLALDAAFVGP